MNKKSNIDQNAFGLKPAIFIQIFHPDMPFYSKSEFEGLAKTAGYYIYDYISQNLKKNSPKFFMGQGKVFQIKESLDEYLNKETIKQIEDNNSNIDNIWDNIATNDEETTDSNELLIINLPNDYKEKHTLTFLFNNRLSYMQLMNLHEIWDVKVIDRDELVLEIFENHAQTKESKLQIELARLTLQTNTVKKDFGQHLQEKQGKDFKGKGMRGWEPRMRAFRGKKKKISDELNKISQERYNRRRSRCKFFNIGIVGYTNAGKSTLMNKLAKVQMKTANQEFTTVTTTSRKATFSSFDKFGNWQGEDAILTDSVGFIDDMSPLLIDAFLSTLEELQFSDLLIIVIDISEKLFTDTIKKIRSSFSVIKQIGAINIPKIFVLNKIDLLSKKEIEERKKKIHNLFSNIEAISISALNKSGLDKLANIIIKIKKDLFKK